MDGSLDKRIKVANRLAAGTRRLAASANIVQWAIVMAVLVVSIASLISRHTVAQAQNRIAQAESEVQALENNERRLETHWGHVHVTAFAGGHEVWLSPGYGLTRLRCKALACYRIDKISQ